MNGIIELIYSLILVSFLMYIFPKVKREKGVKGVLILYLSLLVSIGLYITVTSLFWGTEHIKTLHILVCSIAVFTIFFLITVISKIPQDISMNMKSDQAEKVSIKDEGNTEIENNKNTLFPPILLKAFYSEFYKANLINQVLDFEEFKIALNEKRLCINLNSPSLYFFHTQIKLINKDIKLNEFITYFKDINGNDFNYGTVRNGKIQTEPLHKELIESIFETNTMTKQLNTMTS